MKLGVGEEDDGEEGGLELGVEVPLAFLAILVHIVTGHLLEQRAEKRKHVVLLSEGIIAIGMGTWTQGREGMQGGWGGRGLRLRAV
jgi:hypothetical protein